ncbi:hypothetical protein ABA31_14820 [Agrococcus baldri]|uniref:Uncharacterized protein n=2 Tax=Agrococcus baldri TaxID=153730 RepID=A0AA87URM0_9MICO|nr:hypothetical protein ABA31_14820 [Agrococcus baldri]
MSFFSPDPSKHDKEPTTMASRILSFCFAALLGVVLLYLAIELLAQIWGWLVLIGVIALGAVAAIWIYRWRSSRW